MPDPTPERIYAALRLAEADDDWYGSTAEDPEPGWCDSSKAHYLALRAYRATLPKLRTRAEVDAEIAAEIRAYHRHITRPGWKEIPDWDSFSEGQKRDLNRLCAEPTAPEPAAASKRKCGRCGELAYDAASSTCMNCGADEPAWAPAPDPGRVFDDEMIRRAIDPSVPPGHIRVITPKGPVDVRVEGESP